MTTPQKQRISLRMVCDICEEELFTKLTQKQEDVDVRVNYIRIIPCKCSEKD